MPDKVYLARRDTRQVANEDELMALLTPRGFTRVFPEDLPAADQMRLLIGAKAIVAVHGAGMAPLLYRGGCPPAPIVEILPCGHMTDVFRTVAEQMGCPWIGVRGRIKPQYVAPAYALTAPFTQFSLDAFEVDPVSVEIALDTLAQDPNSAEGMRP